MPSPTYLPRRRCLALAVGLVLPLAAACQGGTVPTPLPSGQGIPQDFDREVLPLPPVEAEEELANTGITRIDLDEPVKVALLLPLTGRHAALGASLLNAAELALFDIAGDRFALLIRDTGGTPDGAREAARSALADGARLVLGPVFAQSVTAMAAEARSRGVSVIAFSNDRSVAGDGVFIAGLAPQPQIGRLVGFAAARGLSRFALLMPRSPYGATVLQALREAVERYGVELIRVISYAPEATDLSQEVRNLANYDARRQALLDQRRILAERADAAAKLALKRLDGLETLGAADFDAVFLLEGGKRIQTIAPLLAFFDIDPAEVRYLGTALWEDPRLRAEPALAGAWFTAPAPEFWAAFQKRYRAAFGKSPPRIASLAYDAIALAAVLARRAAEARRSPDFAPANLAQPSGFAGIDGVFRFLPSGEIERRLAVLELHRDGYKVLEPAPRNFPEITFPEVSF